MAGAAPRVEQETVVGEAQVLQVFELQDKRATGKESVTVAGCRITDGSIRADGRYRVVRQGKTVSQHPLSLLACILIIGNPAGNARLPATKVSFLLSRLPMLAGNDERERA